MTTEILSETFGKSPAPLAQLDLNLPSLAENLALDEALLLGAESGLNGEVLRFWEWPAAAVVLGAGGRLEADVDEDACRLDGVPLLRRASGGGTVLLGRGCLLFSLIVRFDRHPTLKDVNASYRYILGRVISALKPLAAAEQRGISDLAIAGRKFSGNAQQRKREHVLHHGSLLYDFDVRQLSRYLLVPEMQPPYRESRSHDSFMMNLPTDADVLRRLLIEEWKPDGMLSKLPMDRVAELVAEKYSRSDWLRRR
jgi:lipoate-protein ligase A